MSDPSMFIENIWSQPSPLAARWKISFLPSGEKYASAFSPSLVSCLMLARWRSRGSARTESTSNLADLPRVFDGSEFVCLKIKGDPEPSVHRIDSRMIGIRMSLFGKEKPQRSPQRTEKKLSDLCALRWLTMFSGIRLSTASLL